jgi:hypothetical protein
LLHSIKDIADIQIGYQVRAGLSFNPSGAYQVIQAKDIDEENDHALNLGSLQRINASKNLDPYAVENGNLIFLSRGRRRSATVVRGLQPSMPPTIALYYFFIIRIRHPLVRPGFLAWAINETNAREYLASVSRGTGIPFVTKEDFARLDIRIPSIRDQEAISRIHELSVRESRLLRSLEQKRSELRRNTCLAIYGKQDNR